MNNIKETYINPLISFVIPVYNVEQYLDICLKSIINQDFKDIELILVDDGSKDSSGIICDEYSKLDNRIKVLHKRNEGLGAARNDGMQLANGKYIAFIDSDDYIAEGCLENIVNKIKNTNYSDLYLLVSKKIFPNGDQEYLDDNISENDFNIIENKDEKLLRISKMKKYPGSVCGKLFKRELIIKNKMIFPIENYSEDLIYTLKALLYANDIKVINDVYYYYRQNRKGSITGKKGSIKSIAGICSFVNDSVLLLDGEKNSIENAMLSFVAYEYIVLIFHYTHAKENDKKELKKFLNKYIYLLEYNKSYSVRTTKISLKIFGYELTSILLNIYKALFK